MTQENKPDIRQFLETLEQNPDIRREFYQNLVKEVHRDPELRNDLRKEILLQELIELPARFAELVKTFQEFAQAVELRFTRLESTVEQIQQDIVDLKEGQARLEESQTRLEQNQISMSGKIANLEGNNYEIRAMEPARRMIRNRLNMLRARIIHPAQIGSSRNTSEEFEDEILIPAIEEGRITREQAQDIEESDTIIRCTDQTGNTIHAVVEISITIQDSDRSRAFQRAAAFRQATGLETEAFVIGQQAEQPGPNAPAVTFIECPG